MTDTTWRFLHGSDIYRIDLPPGYQLDQSVTSIRVGSEARKIAFHPHPDAEEPADLPYLAPVAESTSPDGLRVSIYEQREPPAVRLLFWRLRAGILISAFNPEHHSDIARYISGIAVDDADLPSISYGPGFERGDQRERGQRDQVWFSAGGAARDRIIGLARLTGGRRTEAPQETSPTWVMRTSATPPGLLLWWGGRKDRSDEIDSRIREVAESVRPA